MRRTKAIRRMQNEEGRDISAKKKEKFSGKGKK
jgi:hypothetical protein